METIQQSTNIYIPFENEYVRLYRSSVVCVQPGRARSKRSKQTILVGVEVAGEQGHRSLNSEPTYCGRTPDGLLLYRRTRGYSPPKTLAPHRHPPYWWSPISRLEPQPNYNQFCRETGSKPANWERQRTSRVDGREVGSAWLDPRGTRRVLDGTSVCVDDRGGTPVCRSLDSTLPRMPLDVDISEISAIYGQSRNGRGDSLVAAPVPFRVSLRCPRLIIRKYPRIHYSERSTVLVTSL
jgi:hypothetical protein